MDPNTSPAAPPPLGVIPDLAHPDSWASITIGVISTTIIVTVIGLVVRVFTKLHIMRQFDYEDYVLVLATIWSLAYNAIILLPALRGFEHLWERPLRSVSPFLYDVYLATIMGALAILFAKWAVLLQLQRVFAVKKFTRIWWTVRAIIATSTLFYVIVVFIYIFICTPREKIWNPTLQGHCVNDPYEAYIITAAVNIALNAAILVVPAMGLRTLQITVRQKVIIGIMFSASLLSLACAIGRAVISVRLLTSTDATRDTAPEAYWAAAEIAFFLLATEFPTTPRFWQWCRGEGGAGGRSGVSQQTPIMRQTTSIAARNASITGRKQSDATAASTAPLRHQDSRDVESGGILRTVDIDVSHTAIV